MISGIKKIFYLATIVILLFTNGCYIIKKNKHNTDNTDNTIPLMKYLALGDSYTIGEGVPEFQRFPMQLTDSLRKEGININDPEIIAKTGWTTDELQAAIDVASPSIDYSLVTLLIGVNNQYRNYSLEAFKDDFTILLKRAIAYAEGNPSRVLVVSIPDWGVTPFAEGRDRALIAREIDEYNNLKKSITKSFKVKFIDITEVSRKYGNDTKMVTLDGLHPSPQLYAKWVSLILPYARSILN